MRNQPWRSQSSRRSRRYRIEEILIPPSPWIGSTSTATTLLSCEATWRTDSMSLNGTRTKPGTNGSNPCCTLRLPVAESVASVLPWKALSITTIPGLPPPVAVQARELDRRLVGFATRVAEEHAVRAAYRRELVRELFLLGDAVEVGGVNQARALLRDRLSQFRVAVAERVDRDTRERIEVLLAGFVPHPHALAAGKGNRNPAVCVHRMRHGITRQCLRHSETLAPKSLWNAP